MPERRFAYQGLSPTCFGRFKRLSDTARWSILFWEGKRCRDEADSRLLVLLVAIGLAVFLWGCGGGGGESTTDYERPRRPPAPPRRSSVGSAVEDLLADQAGRDPGHARGVCGGGRPGPTGGHPLLRAGQRGRRKGAGEPSRRVQADFPDYTFLTYDYKNPSAYGDLSMLLQVNYPPEIVLIDRAGTVRNIWNGYVDEGTLKQCLINLGQG